MIPAAFDYTRPTDLADVLEQLAAGGGGAKVLAGGQSLIPLLRLRLASADKLVDIGGLTELRKIRELPRGPGDRRDRHLPRGARLGAGDEPRPAAGPGHSGHRGRPGPQPGHPRGVDRPRGPGLRHAGHRAGPRGDPGAPLAARRAGRGSRRLLPGRLRHRPGRRRAADRDPHPGPAGRGGDGLSPARAAGLGLLDRRRGGRRRSGGSVTTARVAITGVGDAAYRAAAVEAALAGTKGDAPAIAAAAAHAADGVTVASDIHAGADYRAEMARVHTRRAIEAALAAGD